MKKKWTYEKCKEEISQYKTISEFKNKWIYKVILKNEWKNLLDNFYKIKIGGWSYEECKNISSKYLKCSDLCKDYPMIYKIIKNNKWEELLEHMTFKYWTYDRCLKESLKYEFKSDFKSKSSTAYNSIIKNKWIDIIENMSNKIMYWTYDKCKDYSKEFDNIKDYTKKYPGAIDSIYKHKWFDIIEPMRKVKPRGYWTYEKCKEVSEKYYNISDFRKKNGGAYYNISKNNWFELFNHMKKLPTFYKRLIYVYEFSDKSCYIGLTCNINRRNKQHLKDIKSSVYRYINNKKIYPILIIKSDYIDIKDAVNLEKTELMLYKNNGWNILNKNKTGSIGMTKLYWTKDKCLSEIHKYKTHSEFRKKSPGAYNSAFKNGWLYELLENNIDGYIKRTKNNSTQKSY